MNVSHRFRRMAFMQVMLGLAVFTFATGQIELLVLAMALGGVAWWVAEGPGGKPFAPIIVNLASLIVVGFLAIDLLNGAPIPVAVGRFVLWLQVLLLYARKSNRDYGQLMLLSFMLMVGATILSASLLFGLVFLGYCALAFVNVLLLQLKIAHDRVQRHMAGSSGSSSPNTIASNANTTAIRGGAGLRWHFRLSAGGLGMLCAAIAVVTFLFLPRREVDRAAIQQLLSPTQAQVGFSSEVDLNTSPADGGGSNVVLTMSLSVDGQPLLASARDWLLRGAALDEYDTVNHTWRRSRGSARSMRELDVPRRGLRLLRRPPDARTLLAEVSMHSGAERAIFILTPIINFQSDSLDKVLLDGAQQALLTRSGVRGRIHYQFESVILEGENRRLVTPIRPRQQSYARGWEIQPDRILTLIESVLTERGVAMPDASATTQQRAQALETLASWLSDTSYFRYTLDHDPVGPGEDPIINFLFRDRQGHCEEYGSAFAAMARCLGLQSRVVTGFRASEFNEAAGYYVVRDADAHAWAEVYLPGRGWFAYDPTPPSEVAAESAAARPWLLGMRQRLEHLELLWHRAVISYDAPTRIALLEGISDRVDDFISRQTWLTRWFNLQGPDSLSSDGFTRWRSVLIGIIVFVMLAAGFVLMRKLTRYRYLLKTLHLHRLPQHQRRALGKQLTFYLTMLRLLERHGFKRPSWQGPAAYTAQLAKQDPQRFAPAVTLTEYFYRVRFGHEPVDAEGQADIQKSLATLQKALATRSRSVGSTA